MAAYEVKVHRSGQFWHIAVPALNGSTRALHTTEIHEAASVYIAEATGTPAADVDLHVRFVNP